MIETPVAQLLVVTLIWCAGACGVYGLVPARYRFDERPGNLAAFVAFGAAIGIAATATVGMYIDWWIGVRPIVQWVLLGVYVVVGLRGLNEMRRTWTRCDAAGRHAMWRRALLVVCMLAPLIVVMAPAATTPYIYGDDDAYHVSLLRYWFQEQQLDRTAFHSYFVFPLFSSGIAALFVPLVGLQAAKLVQLLFVVTAAIGIYGVVLLTTGRNALALVAAFLYETLPAHFMWAFVAMADRATGCFVTLGVSALLLTPMIGAVATLLLSAFLLAAAMSMKQQGAFALVGLLPLVWKTVRAQESARRRLLVLAGVGLVCLFVLTPWYGRAYWTTGDPVFPMRAGANHPLLTPAQRLFWSGSVVDPDLEAVTTLFEQLYAYSSDRFNDATNPMLLVLLPIVGIALARCRRRLPPGTRDFVSVVAAYLVLLGLLSLFFVPGVRVNGTSVWSPGRYRTYLYPVHGSLFVFGALCCAAVGLRPRGTRVLAMSAVAILLAQTVNLTAYLRWSVRPFLGLQSSDSYLAEFHSLGHDLVLARQLLTDRDRVALDRHRTQINVPGRIRPTTRLLSEAYSTKRTLETPATCAGPADLATWLSTNGLDAIVTSTEACPGARDWSRDSRVDVTVGREIVIVRLSRR